MHETQFIQQKKLLNAWRKHNEQTTLLYLCARNAIKKRHKQAFENMF